MANRTFYPSQSYGSGRVYAEFRFTPQGAATSVPLTAVTGADVVSSISHAAGTNKFTVTLKDTFYDLIAHSADLVDPAAPVGNYCTAGNKLNFGVQGGTSNTPCTFQVNTFTAAGAALNDAPSTADIVVAIALKNTAGWGSK